MFKLNLPAIKDICDECGTLAVCTTVEDETGEFPVCPSCKAKHFPAKIVRFGLGAHIKSRQIATA